MFLESSYRAQNYLRLCFEIEVKPKGQGQLWVVYSLYIFTTDGNFEILFLGAYQKMIKG